MSISQLSERAMIYPAVLLMQKTQIDVNFIGIHVTVSGINIIDILLVSVSVLSSIYTIHNLFTIPSEMFMKAQK